MLLIQLSKFRLLFIVRRANLYHWSKTSDFHRYGLTALRISSQHTLTYFMFSLRSQCSFYQRVEVLIEHLHQISPLLFPFGHFVEFLFYAGRKVIVHNFREILHQEVVNHTTYIGRNQFGFLTSAHFRLYSFLYIFSRQF